MTQLAMGVLTLVVIVGAWLVVTGLIAWAKGLSRRSDVVRPIALGVMVLAAVPGLLRLGGVGAVVTWVMVLAGVAGVVWSFRQPRHEA
jgi:hypothetical protein